MPDCRRKLTEPTGDLPSQHDVIGQNCHIVAETANGPRGNSPLTLDERNRYPNLVLLCKPHHEMIDQSFSAWPIERLHQVKADHEVWVETCLVMATNVMLEVYTDLIMSATSSLCLESWATVSDNAVRGLSSEKIINGIYSFAERVFRANWPDALPELRAAIENLSQRAHACAEHYMTLAIDRGNGHYMEDRAWKTTMWSQAEYARFEARSTKWRRRHADLLCDFVVALNVYAEAVRQYLKPRYFIYEGRFAVHDSLGVTNNGVGTVYIPDAYRIQDAVPPENSIRAEAE